MLINNLLIQIKAKENGKFGQEFCEQNSDFVTSLLRYNLVSDQRKM